MRDDYNGLVTDYEVSKRLFSLRKELSAAKPLPANIAKTISDNFWDLVQSGGTGAHGGTQV